MLFIWHNKLMKQINFKIKHIHIRLHFSELAAILSWLMVFMISLNWLSHASAEFQAHSAAIVFWFLAYITCFIMVIKRVFITITLFDVPITVYLQLICAFALLWFLPVIFISILTLIWVAILPHFVSIKKSILMMLAVVCAWFGLHYIIWQQQGVIISAILFASFHLFALLMMHQTKLAEYATQKSERLNQELQSAQYLLTQATQLNERTRISRDLHDLLGHHLTALIINLQVAGHISQGEAKTKVEQCHSLAKLLLSDVREAVSTLRENQQLNFVKMIELMIADIPKLKINLDIKDDFVLEDIDIAKHLLTIIQEASTNTLRHSGASEFWISLSDSNGILSLILFDNGTINRPFMPGNGLKGMQERVALCGGVLLFDDTQECLKIKITLSLNNKDKYAN